MNDRTVGWVAGLIEGEGNIGVYGNGGRSRRGSARVAVSMTDFDVVHRLHEVTGLGGLHVKRPYSEGHLPQLRWTVTKKADVLQVLYTVWPLLGERKQAAATAAIQHVLASPGQGWRRDLARGAA